MKNRDYILQQKRERRAEKKATQAPKPPLPPPTPEQRAKVKEQNRKACQKYRASHLVRVRTVNRAYYHRNRDKIVQQQRDLRALAKQGKPVSKITRLGSSVRGTMAGADSEAKKTRTAKTSQARQKAAVDGLDKCKALNRQRYRLLMERLKASGQYETFKAKKTVEGFKRYRDMTKEAREERKRKNLLCQKNWRDKMKVEGTYEEYQARLNAHRRAQVAAKRRAMGPEANRALQREHCVKRRNRERLKKDLAFRTEVEPHLA